MIEHDDCAIGLGEIFIVSSPKNLRPWHRPNIEFDRSTVCRKLKRMNIRTESGGTHHVKFASPMALQESFLPDTSSSHQ
jgi:hypothetical protein